MLTDEALSSLERLGKLHDQGVLSDEEFALGKDRILRR
ncbi:SHOCT domain-containing protein [Streptomyces sp. NPDC046385]